MLDSGREILLSCVTKYFATQNTVFTIKGLDRKLTKVDEVFIRSADGIELIFSDVTFSRRKLISRSSVYVTKFVLNGSDDEIDLEAQLKGLIPLMRTLRIFMSDLKLGRGYLYKIANEPFYLDNLKYISKEKEDFLYSDINMKHSLDVVFRWDGLRSVAGDIKFKNIAGFSATLLVKNPDAEISDYELTAKKDDCEIQSHGSYKDFMFDIKIDDATVKYDDEIYTAAGNVFLKKQAAKLTAEIALEKIINDTFYLPNGLKNVRACFDVDCDFKGNGKINLVLRNENENIGEFFGEGKNSKWQISGDLSRIDWWGFNFANLDAQVDGFKTATITVNGEEATIAAALNFGDKPEITSLALTSEKGFVKSSKPFLLAKDTECSFDFNFSQLDFWDKIVPIAGSGLGSITYKNGFLFGQAEFAKLKYDNKCKFFALKISGDEKNFTCDAETFKASSLLLRRVNLKKHDDTFECSGVVNETGTLKADGNVFDNYRRISLKHGEIASKNSKLVAQICDLDFEKGFYKVKCAVFNKKSEKRGSAEVIFSPTDLNIGFKDFQIFKLTELFKQSALKCTIDGDAKFALVNGCFIGNGKFVLREILARNNVLNVNANMTASGMKIVAELKKGSDTLAGNAILPLRILGSGNIATEDIGNALSCHVSGHARLEQLLELTDNLDIKGDLNCDVSINGSFANPTVKGSMNLNGVYIAIGDLILKNGNIALLGNGKKIVVSQAKFIDDSSHTATISGDGTLVFDGGIPDIETNLKLAFANFTLFDSDSMKVIVDGMGKITGPIRDLKLAGKINVPKCEIQHFETDNTFDSGIEVENAAHTGRKGDEDEGDVFNYDVDMHCPKIKFSGSVFDVKLGGDLNLTSYLNKATLKGKLELSDGKLDLFGKRMKFTKGRVEFLEEFPFDPKAILTCKGMFGDIGVRLDIKNRPNKGVTLQLSSTPNHSEDVILSMMLFGKDVKYLSVGEAAQLAHAMASINKKGYIFSILNALQSSGLVDSLSFSTGDNGSSALYSNTQTLSQNNVNVSAGKYIHDNVYVSVNKKEEETTFDVDVSLTSRTSVKANTAGEVGISWKYRY